MVVHHDSSDKYWWQREKSLNEMQTLIFGLENGSSKRSSNADLIMAVGTETSTIHNAKRFSIASGLLNTPLIKYQCLTIDPYDWQHVPVATPSHRRQEAFMQPF